MIKDAMEKNEKATPNGADLDVLKKHFGMCFNSDGSLDLEKLKARLGDQVAISNEGYELKFLGKNYARLLTSLETTTVVVPDEKHNAKPENAKSKNVYISGDNLDALKHLLKSKQGQVKCIYIDPPYNTGSDGFVYNDSFGFKVEELASKLSISEDEAQRILDFTKRGSASHSAWLMFMYPRLMLARDLLAKDGVIFISIDSNESHNLKLMCDEIFGGDNFVAEIACVNKPSGRSDDKYIATAHESIFIYRRSETLEFGGFVPEEQIVARYSKKDKDGRLYRDEDLRKRGSHDERKDRPNLFYPFFFNEQTKELRIGENEDTTPDGFLRIVPMKDIGVEGTWRWGRETAAADLTHLRAGYMENKGQWTVFEMQYLDERGDVKPLSVWQQKDVNSERGTEAFEELGFDSNVFQNPKPVGTLKRLFHIAKTQNATIVDFFSGSGTAAQAVMQLNAEDGGNRQFILVQLPEKCPEKSAAFTAGYKTIDEIGQARIKKAAAKIAAENPLLAKTMDLGFKHYTLKEVEGKTLDKIEKFDLNDNALAATDDILKEFGVDTVLATWLVHDGYGFSAEPKVIDLDGYKAYWMEKHIYLIEPGLSDTGISALFDKFETEGSFNPGNVVVFGYSFSWTQLEALKNNLLKIAANGTNKHVLLDKRY